MNFTRRKRAPGQGGRGREVRWRAIQYGDVSGIMRLHTRFHRSTMRFVTFRYSNLLLVLIVSRLGGFSVLQADAGGSILIWNLFIT